jgi:hypothetical protein
MRALTIPVYRPPAPEPPPTRGRWIWVLSGLGTMALVAWPIAILISNAGDGGGQDYVMSNPTATRTVTISQPVTSLSVESYGGPIQVTAASVHHVTVTESLSYLGPGPAPAVTAAVAAGRLTLSSADCADSGCMIGFTVTVPKGVAVDAESDNGGISVSGVAGANLDSEGGPVRASNIDGPVAISSENGSISVLGATAPGGINLDSGGGPVRASGIDGPLTISSEDGAIMASDVTAPGVNLDSGGGPVTAGQVKAPLTVTSEDGNVDLNGVTGDVNVDTGGGSIAGDVTAARASVLTEDGTATLSFDGAPGYVFLDTGGGSATLLFDRPPNTVLLTTDDGSASLSVPGGPYAVTASTEGASETIDVPTSPAAQRSITVSTGGGPLQIVPR